MANYDFSSQPYTLPDITSELLNRPNNKYHVQGQAEFLGLALQLRIPILSNARNIEVLAGASISGAGVSFAVSSFDNTFQAQFDLDFVNVPRDDWFQATTGVGSTRAGSADLVYVVKRIRTDASYSEAQHLASIVNEMRILSNRTLRQMHNIVTLFGISWYEKPDGGRYWPQLLVESAELGTLDSYLRCTSVSFQTKAMLALGVLSGLNSIHIHHITHCDLKPANILIFNDPRLETKTTDGSTIRIEPVIAKLCDFGSAVIHTDYDVDKPIQGRIGTSPWMVPEMEEAVPIELKFLHSTDLYSFGLVFASILMNGRTPFANVSHESITDIKWTQTEDCSAYKTVGEEIAKNAPLPATVMNVVHLILIFTLSPNPEARLGIEGLMNSVKLGFMISSYLPEDDSSKVDADDLSSSLTSLSVKDSTTAKVRTYIHHAAERATKVFDNFTGRSRKVEALSEAMFGQRYIETEPILHIDRQLAENLDSTLKRGEEDKTTDRSSPVSNSAALNPIPDLCFEYEFRPSGLPKNAAREILSDLEHQAETLNACPGYILYALAGSYINGSIVQRDLEQGLNFFERAANAGHRRALISLRNVLSSCGKNLSSDSEANHAQLMNDADIAIHSAAVSLVMPRIPWQIDFDDLLAEQWANCKAEKYLELVSSAERISFSGLLLMIQNVTHPVSTPTRAQFDTAKLPSYKGSTKYLRLSQLDQESFVQDLRRTKSLESVDETSGFTLLQRAVSLGDQDMVELLIREGASLDNYGNTPRWTPLWIACFSGQFSVAQILMEGRASVRCRDQHTGFTILHILNQFTSLQQCDTILKEISRRTDGSLSLNTPSSQGLSPLHSSFLGWDFSRGQACRSLLNHGADPTVQCADGRDFITPIGLCTQRLDVVLLEQMLRCPYLTENQNRKTRERLAEAKAQACRLLLLQTEFGFRSQAGNDWYTSLEQLLDLLIDENSMHAFRNDQLNREGVHYLDVAINYSKRHIARILLRKTSLGGLTTAPGMELLHRAIERRLDDLVIEFATNGADLTTVGEDEQTALHVAAHHNPAILPWMIGRLTITDQVVLGGRTIKDILEMRNCRGFDVVGLLLAEGSEEQGELVDDLRNKFDLDLDAMNFVVGEVKLTLTATLIGVALSSAVVPLSQIEYLLNLEPPPRFVCSDVDETLLTTAISGSMAYQTSLDYIGHEIAQLVLDRYPDVENIRTTPDHFGAVHRAGFWSNTIAIERILGHLERQCPGNSGLGNAIELFAQISNETDAFGATALDNTIQIFVEESWVYKAQSDKHLQKRQSAALECYKKLRELGAIHDLESKGVMTISRMMWRSLVDDGQWNTFLEHLSHRLGDIEVLKHPVIEMSVDESEPGLDERRIGLPQLNGKTCRMRCLELVWRVDRFALRTFDLHLPAIQYAHSLKRSDEERKAEIRVTRMILNAGLTGDTTLWNTRTYKQGLPVDAKRIVSWTRRGQIWSNEDFKRLRDQFQTIWEEKFGNIERALTERADGRPVIFAS